MRLFKLLLLLAFITIFTLGALAQSYATKFTAVRTPVSSRLYEETTLFFYTDSTLEVVGTQIVQKFKLREQVHISLFNIEDEQGQCATIEYFIFEEVIDKKKVVRKIIKLRYDKEYTFFFEKP